MESARFLILKLSARWNPFRKKSGILGVIYAQSKKNRVVSKHGKLNTFRNSTPHFCQ